MKQKLISKRYKNLRLNRSFHSENICKQEGILRWTNPLSVAAVAVVSTVVAAAVVVAVVVAVDDVDVDFAGHGDLVILQVSCNRSADPGTDAHAKQNRGENLPQ